MRALAAAATEHTRATRRLLVLGRGVVGRGLGPKIEVQPAYEWLLSS